MMHKIWQRLVTSPLWWGGCTVLFGLLVFFVWAIFAPLDQGVSSPGVVKVSGNRKLVQSAINGVVKEIKVKDGDSVQQGQILVRMDETNARSQLGVVEAEYYSLLGLDARLHAEQTHQAQINFPADLDSKNLQALQARQLQQALFQTRRAALKGEVAILQKNIAGLNAQKSSLREAKISKEQQLQNLQSELKSLSSLAEEGYIPKTRVFELQRAVSSQQGAISQDIGSEAKIEQDVAERQLQILRRQQDFDKEVETQLSQVVSQLSASRDKRAGLIFELAHAEIKAPNSGTVVSMVLNNTGVVLPMGAHILEIVPQHSPLIIEAQIATHLIDKVTPNLPVEIHFLALNKITTPVIAGRLIQVSADSLTDEKSKQSYYLAQIEVTPEGLKDLRNDKIMPGMPVEVIIKTGERSLMNYLLRPLQNRVLSAFKEA